MTTFERIKNLADNQKISLQKIATEIGLSENAIYGWKTRKPKADDLAKIADYFHVSVDYLLGREKDSQDEKQFSPELEDAIEHAEAFEGTPLTTQDKAILRGLIAAYLENRDSSKGQ
ncbi:helix-turn-helix domain-containing protein [Lactococcus lactis]